MPSGAVSITSTLVSGYFAGRQSNRWFWIAIFAAPAVLGGGLMSFLPAKRKGGLLAGVYLVNCVRRAHLNLDMKAITVD